MASPAHHPTMNHIFVCPRRALKFVCGPQNINITKLPRQCGAHAFIDPSQVISQNRLVNIILSGPMECQIRALGELSYCLMNFNANLGGRTYRGSRNEPYRREQKRPYRKEDDDDTDHGDGEIVENKNSDPY